MPRVTVPVPPPTENTTSQMAVGSRTAAPSIQHEHIKSTQQTQPQPQQPQHHPQQHSHSAAKKAHL